MGDINTDGSITDEDARMLLGYISDSSLLTPKQFRAANANEDNKYDILDVIWILQNKTA